MLSRVCVVMAHPDDAELLCAGTMFRLSESGSAMSLVVVSNGCGGISVKDQDRRKELDRAAV